MLKTARYVKIFLGLDPPPPPQNKTKKCLKLNKTENERDYLQKMLTIGEMFETLNS